MNVHPCHSLPNENNTLSNSSETKLKESEILKLTIFEPSPRILPGASETEIPITENRDESEK